MSGAYFAVIGRMCGDEEDTVELFANCTRAEARQAFIELMWELEGLDPDELVEMKALADRGGGGVRINHVLKSSASITD